MTANLLYPYQMYHFFKKVVLQYHIQERFILAFYLHW